MLALATNTALQWRRLRRRQPVPPSARRTRLFVIGGIAAAIGIAIAATMLDARSLEWSASLSPAWRSFFGFVTRFGKSEWWLVPSAVACLVLLAGDWRRADPRAARAWAEIGALIAFVFFAVAFSGLTTDLVKLVVGRSRPALFGEAGHLAFNPFRSGYLHLSFPSGHATTVAAATTAIALFAWRAGILVGLFALLVCVSRVAVGAHFPSDVVGGAFVGATITVLLAMLWSRARYGFARTSEEKLLARTGAIRRLWRAGGARALVAGLRGPFSP